MQVGKARLFLRWGQTNPRPKQIQHLHLVFRILFPEHCILWGLDQLADALRTSAFYQLFCRALLSRTKALCGGSILYDEKNNIEKQVPEVCWVPEVLSSLAEIGLERMTLPPSSSWPLDMNPWQILRTKVHKRAVLPSLYFEVLKKTKTKPQRTLSRPSLYMPSLCLYGSWGSTESKGSLLC